MVELGSGPQKESTAKGTEKKKRRSGKSGIGVVVKNSTLRQRERQIVPYILSRGMTRTVNLECQRRKDNLQNRKADEETELGRTWGKI